MRNIRDLVKDRERVWLYFGAEEDSQDFLQRAAAEGFHWSNGSALVPGERKYVLAVHRDCTVSHVPLYCWILAFREQETIPGTPVCVDYGKYLAGAEDYRCHESHFTGGLIF